MSFALPSVLSIAATYLVLRYVFRQQLAGSTGEYDDGRPLSTDGKIVLAAIVCMVAVLLTASALDRDLGLPTCLAALGITAVMCIKARSNPLSLLKEISWATIALVAGLFIMVDAVQSMGALKLTQRQLIASERCPRIKSVDQPLDGQPPFDGRYRTGHTRIVSR